MKRLIILALLCLYPVMAHSHPGKTDRYGGHKCFKDCEEWGLFYAEYHLHDKEGKPIRVNKKTKKTPDSGELQSAATETAVSASPPKTETVTVYRTIATVYEENLFLSNPLISVLLILLLLLLVLRMNRKREEG